MFFPRKNRVRVVIPIAGVATVLLLSGCTPTLTVSTATVDPIPTVSIAALPLTGTDIHPVTQVVVKA